MEAPSGTAGDREWGGCGAAKAAGSLTVQSCVTPHPKCTRNERGGLFLSHGIVLSIKNPFLKTDEQKSTKSGFGQ